MQFIEPDDETIERALTTASGFIWIVLVNLFGPVQTQKIYAENYDALLRVFEFIAQELFVGESLWDDAHGRAVETFRSEEFDDTKIRLRAFVDQARAEDRSRQRE